MLRRLFQIALSPFFQALLVAGLTILLIPLGLKKYSAEQVSMSTTFDKSQFVFADLDHDGTSERIHTFINFAGNVGVALLVKNATLGQWNFRGIYQPDCARIMIGDYNNNKFDEIYFFTLVSDSVMLHGMEYSSKTELIIHDRFIAKIGKSLKDPDHVILPGLVADMNGDSLGELIFCISSGFSRQPRNVFIYDIKHDTLIKSPESGAFISQIAFSDLDQDGFQEIMLSTYAAANFNDDPFPYSDTSSWIMVLDHDLKFLFPPLELPGPTGSSELIAMNSEKGEPLILGRFGHASPFRNFGMLFLADPNGIFLKKKEIKADDILFKLDLLSNKNGVEGNKVTAAIENSGFYEIDETLDIRLISDTKFSRTVPTLIDIDLDSNDEIIILAPEHDQHLILREDFTCPVPIDIPVQSTVPLFSVKLNGDQPPQLSVQGDRNWILFNYGINPVYFYRFLIFFGIYLFLLGFILIIRKLYSFQLKKRYDTEKKIARLQLSSVKAQMEPHFIMNTINTIGSSIYRQKGEDAYRQLLNFSGMVRSLLISSDKLTRTVKEETEFVTNYLELEKSRFGEVFEFSINIKENISPETIIPKMIIQLHAENALNHGLLPKKSGGRLEISLSAEKEYLIITITDNGIGRNMSSKSISQSTGKGMKIIGQLFETYNKHNKIPLRQEITDLFDDENKASGTLVKIFVPLNFNEGIF